MQLYSSSAVKKAGNFWPGTLGGFFTFTGEEGIYGLSNAHVLSDLTNGTPDLVICTAAEERIGVLSKWTGLSQSVLNLFDAAFFLLDDGITPIWNLPVTGGLPSEFAGVALNEQVFMISGNNQVWGTVSDPAITYTADFNNYEFTGLMEITGTYVPFSTPGDSGNLIYNSASQIIGLLIGTSPDTTTSYAVPFINGAGGLAGDWGKFTNLQIWSPAFAAVDQNQLS